MARMVRTFPLALVAVLVGCSPAFWQGFSQGLSGSSGQGVVVHKLMVFGGPGHKTYLGCLSCNEYDQESIFNDYGKFGSDYSAQSIHNHFSNFGSAYSSSSACNPYASDPPVIVDEQGRYYGRLTVNTYRSDGPKGELATWLAAVCGD